MYVMRIVIMNCPLKNIGGTPAIQFLHKTIIISYWQYTQHRVMNAPMP